MERFFATILDVKCSIFCCNLKVRQICHIALKRDHEFINTVQEGTGETHTQVGFFDEINYVLDYLCCNLNFLDYFRSDRCI